MSTNKDKSDTIGLVLMIITTILFISLKITNTVSWNWFWVFTPIWGVVALFLLLVIAGYLLEFLSRRF